MKKGKVVIHKVEGQTQIERASSVLLALSNSAVSGRVVAVMLMLLESQLIGTDESSGNFAGHR